MLLSCQHSLNDHAKIIQDLGFSVEEFGPDSIKITHIPEFFKDHDVPNILSEILDSEDSFDVSELIDTQSHTMLRFLACRNAIKAGDPLTKKQCKTLLEELEKTPNNKTCPHGRPTNILLPLKDFHKLFKRV
jgi:DNA mismatch repair protein MutL